jgi:hypothetical protein
MKWGIELLEDLFLVHRQLGNENLQRQVSEWLFSDAR